MPEGDTIFRTARALSRALTGKPIVYFDTALAQIAQSNDQAAFTGQTVAKVESRGKWLLIHIADSASSEPSPARRASVATPSKATRTLATRAKLDTTPKASAKKEPAPAPAPPSIATERILATHMLMSGSWHLYQPGDPWQESDRNARIIIEVADYQAVGFRIPVAKIYTPHTLARDKKIPTNDRDVLHDSFDPEAAIERLLARGLGPSSDELGDAILRQDVLAGVGNVFKSEILFTLKLNPFRKVSSLTRRSARQIVESAQKLLAANVLEDSDSLIVTYSGRKRRTTQNATPGDNLWVYGRKNEPCRICKTPIQRALQGRNARSTYWCPHCQPAVAE